MQDSETGSRLLEVFLFIDESACKMENCRPGCKRNVNILCRHRLDFEAHVFHNDVFGVPGSSDFEVILNSFDYIARIKRNKVEKIQWRRTTWKKFIIWTKDERFFEDAAAKTKKAKQHDLSFDKENCCVSRDGVFVHILYLECTGHDQKKKEQRLCIIRELNRRSSEGLAPF